MMPVHNAPAAGPRKINYTMFEADRLPASWVPRAREFDLTIVPTEACYQAWVASGVSTGSLRICPMGVDGRYFSPAVPLVALRVARGRLLTSYRHRFLNVSALGSRKNQMGLLRCGIRATCAKDEAVMVLKTWVPDEDLFQADLANMLRDHRLRLSGAAPIIFVPEYLTEEMLRVLYLTCTHYISMSRGEGWDLAMMEAAVCGLDLIAPRHTAYVSYLREDEVNFIPASLRPATFEGYTDTACRELFEGLRWWEPDEDFAVEIIRGIVQGRKEARRSPQARIAAEYSWEKAAARLIQLISPA